MKYIRNFEHLRKRDVLRVGGKNASLGEMIRVLSKLGVAVPEGFATTASAYFAFLDYNDLRSLIKKEIADLKKGAPLSRVGKRIRTAILKGVLPKALEVEISLAYSHLSRRHRKRELDVAVRSSATAEDLPEASFAGQQESFLNVVGKKALLQACLECYASLFTDRAIAYREEKGFSHTDIALSVGVQKMVRADVGSSGVLFTLDPESGFRDVVVINAAFGLGENVVQGAIEPDQYMIYKPLLKEGCSPIIEKTRGKKELRMIYGKRGVKNLRTTASERGKFALKEEQILTLAKWGTLIENHYKCPMDIEWAYDGRSKKLYVVQARPETVHSQKKPHVFETHSLKKKGKVLIKGLAIGSGIATGNVQVIESVSKIGQFKPGSILVTKLTSPDWVPIMKQASGIVTDHGGRTSHAAIVSRELGLPAIVGTEDGTKKLRSGKGVTLSCAEGEIGMIYEGILPFETKEIDIEKLPKMKTDLMLNMASPGQALRWWHLPVKGVGLARMEFIINNQIKIHPMALVHFKKIKEERVRAKIEAITKHSKSKKGHFIDTLARGIGKIAAPVYPHPVIVRMSDFKTNEYANLIGGKQFEPKEENPMLGFRGACRYYSPRYREGFALECAAIRKVREELGFTNVLVMIPFCRTLEEADKVLSVMEEEGLVRGEKGLEVYVMCEIPSNVILASDFAKRFDGFSIGSNDLTQLVLGVDRDAEGLAPLFDERNEAVKGMIKEVIQKAKESGKKIGICGQAPSDFPDFARFLIDAGIDSISLNPDSVIDILTGF